MAKYSVSVSVVQEKGIESKMTYSAHRRADPPGGVGSGEVWHSNKSTSEAITMGVYDCIKDAEDRGEKLGPDDLEVTIHYETHVMRGNKLSGVQRREEKGRYLDIYNEIMSRPRPLQ